MVLISFLHATFMKIENDFVHEIQFKKKEIIDLGGGGQIFVKSFAGLVSVYKKHTYRSEMFEC